MDILAMLKICIGAVGSAVLMPGANFGFILFLFIVFMQYRKNLRMQEIIYGKAKTGLNNLVATSVLAGIAAGILISIPMTLVGVSFSQDMGIQYLVPISLMLMLVEPRFLCFSYSGGILALVSLLFGINKIDVTGIMVLVAILHLLESILIYFDGHRGALPVFLEREDGEVVGGFTMQRFWPIPLAIILFVGYGGVVGDVVSTPDWWPIIRPHIEPGRLQEALFTASPIAAVLGYGEFTSSYMPGEKCKNSAYKLAVFSLILLLLSILSSNMYAFKFIAALFAPIGHEMLIQYEKRLEKNKKPIFSPSSKGLRVLDTLPDGPGESMGIQPGDIIMSINGRLLMNEEELEQFFKDYITYIWVDVEDRYGKVRTLEYKDYQNGIDSLDILIVPQSKEGLVTVRGRESFIKSLFKRRKGTDV